MTRARPDATVIATSVLATVSCALPGFLVGGLAVQVRAEFGVSEAVYAWAMSAYFLAGSFGSVGLGRLAQRIGPRRQIAIALCLAAAADLTIAVAADSFGVLVAVLAALGLCNAATQTAVNLALAGADLRRLGLAISIKQSGMPLASMLSGLAVPVIALTLGWRWAFVAAAAVTTVAAGAAAAVLTSRPPRDPTLPTVDVARRPGSPRRVLVAAAVTSALLSIGAGSLNAWVVESGVDAGLAEGTAGLLLAVGAGLGVSIRLGWGVRLDRRVADPFRTAGVMALGGAAGIALLGLRMPGVHVAATLLAFGAGWIWPVFTNFGIVRANAGHAAAATGVTQTGVYVGVFASPLITGWLIEHAGYGAMWTVSAVGTAAGAVLAIRIAHHFRIDPAT